ncbi:hypothetical protein D3C86_2162040 [compost metagenome]
MPVAHGKAQVVLHALAQHQAVFVVPLEGQGGGGLGALVGDRGDGGEVVAHGVSLCDLVV